MQDSLLYMVEVIGGLYGADDFIITQPMLPPRHRCLLRRFMADQLEHEVLPGGAAYRSSGSLRDTIFPMSVP